MSTIVYDRDATARWHAKQLIKTDSGIRSIYYLPKNASDREIRFVEVNDLLADRTDDTLAPVDFGIDRGMESEFKLCVLDVTPRQWDRIRDGALALPVGWSLDDVIEFPSH